MNCPRCRDQKLRERTLNGVRIDYCDGCEGIWFDAEELEQAEALAASGVDVPPDAKEGSCLCPKCHAVMYEFYYPQTYCSIDMCKKCKGLWLDAKELTEIRVVRGHHKKKGKLEKVAPPTGIKGALVNFVNSTLDRMTKFD